MSKYTRRDFKFNFYTELCPAASVATIGVGIITITLGGSFAAAISLILSGIVLGVITPSSRVRIPVVIDERPIHRAHYSYIRHHKKKL